MYFLIHKQWTRTMESATIGMHICFIIAVCLTETEGWKLGGANNNNSAVKLAQSWIYLGCKSCIWNICWGSCYGLRLKWYAQRESNLAMRLTFSFFYSWEVASPCVYLYGWFPGRYTPGAWGSFFVLIFYLCIFSNLFFVTCNKPWGSVDIGSFVQCTFVPMLFVLGNEDHICL